MTEPEMAGWYHQCNGHELRQTPGDGEGQGGLACCSPWDCKESDTTYRQNNNNKHHPKRWRLYFYKKPQFRWQGAEKPKDETPF